MRLKARASCVLGGRQECLLRRVGTDKGTIHVVSCATAAEARHCLDKLRGGIVRGAHGAFGRVDGKAPELPIQPDRAETGRSDKRVLAAISYTSNWPVLTLCSTRSDAPGEWTGATPANCQSSPTEPMKEAEVTWLLAIS